jgi:Domain of unknown function (DUF4359)
MKASHVIAGVLGLGVLGLGAAMAATNPTDEAFETFAIAQLKTKGCEEMPSLIKSQCPSFVQDNQVAIKKLIRQHSDRKDFLVFSLYETNLSVRSIVPELPFFINAPTFHLQTVGIFGKFYIYEAEKRQ